MAEHPDVTLVRRGYDAFSRGDLETLMSLMTADCTHHVPGDHALAGHHKGQAEIRHMITKVFEESGGTFKADLQSVILDGRGHAVSVHRYSAQRHGRSIDAMGGLIFTIVGGKFSDIDECVEDLDADNAFWS